MKDRQIADLEAERAVLGSALLSSDGVLAAMEHVTPRDFAAPAHRFIFGAMIALARDGEPVDCLTVHALLKDREQTELAGGMAGVAALAEAVPTGEHVEFYARRVRSKAQLRELAKRALRIAHDAHQAEDADQFIADAQGRILGLTDDDTGGPVETAEQWTLRTLEHLTALSEEDTAPGIKTGFYPFDRFGGLPRSSLTIVAGRPGMGKTALAQNIALHASDYGHRVFFTSIEQPRIELAERYIGMEAGIDTRDLRRPYHLVRSPNWDKVCAALRKFSERPLDVWCPSSVSFNDLRVRVLRAHAMEPVDLVVLDYIQLMRGSGMTREQEIAGISRGLKILSKEINGAVVALSQLNRKVDERKPPIPIPSDLRESGSLEQDADLIAFLYRPCVYEESKDPEYAELIISKNRHGPTQTNILRFQAPYQRFSD